MPETITCPVCRRTSWNPTDIEQGYCGACHWWTSNPLLGGAVTFVFKCAGGHTVDVTDDEAAKRMMGTACSRCYRPLTVAGVKV